MFKANSLPPRDLDGLRQFVIEEFQRLAIELESGNMEFLQLAERHVLPLKPRDGLVVFADGTNWNPGAGRGVYVYSSGAWAKL